MRSVGYNRGTKRGEADESGKDLILQGILSVAVIMDCRSGKIRNPCIVLGLSAGCFIRIVLEQVPWHTVMANVSVPILLFYLLFCMHVLGAGDIKLFCVVGAFWSIQDLCTCILISFMAGGVISFSKLLIQRELFQSLQSVYFYLQTSVKTKTLSKYPGRDKHGHQIHFSVAIFIGFLLTMGVKYGGIIYSFIRP